MAPPLSTDVCLRPGPATMYLAGLLLPLSKTGARHPRTSAFTRQDRGISSRSTTEVTTML
jgi:hypothetical protein